jgi:hypothetical protein
VIKIRSGSPISIMIRTIASKRSAELHFLQSATKSRITCTSRRSLRDGTADEESNLMLYGRCVVTT